MTMSVEDLARSVAKDVAPELGADIPAKTDDVLHGEGSRGWGHVNQALEIGAFIVHTAGLAWDIYKEYRDMTRVRELVSANANPPAGISEDKAKLIVDAVLKNLPDKAES
jgi:hypothetical protein